MLRPREIISPHCEETRANNDRFIQFVDATLGRGGGSLKIQLGIKGQHISEVNCGIFNSPKRKKKQLT